MVPCFRVSQIATPYKEKDLLMQPTYWEAGQLDDVLSVSPCFRESRFVTPSTAGPLLMPTSWHIPILGICVTR